MKSVIDCEALPLTLNITEAAKVYGSSRSTIYRLIATGKIKPVKCVGADMRIITSSLIEFVEGGAK